MSRIARFHRAIQHLDQDAPVLSCEIAGNSDGVLVPAQGVEDARTQVGTRAVFADVLNPLGRAMSAGFDLNTELSANPEVAERRLLELEVETMSEIQAALTSGADGIFYRLEGAYPEVSTPMQFGGHHLELERGILAGAMKQGFLVLFVAGGGDAYLDALSDLPCHAIGWDDTLAPLNDEMLKTLHGMPLALASEAGVIRLNLCGRQVATAC